MEKFMHALQFAADKHRLQKRKDQQQTPYINHPIGVAYILSNEAGVTDFDILAAALLHDTIEDTDTKLDELEREFGSRIAGIVAELTDDKSLPYADRKRLQIENACGLSHDAVVVRLADKINNLRDLTRATPKGWTEERIRKYWEWSSEVARQLLGHNDKLDAILKELFLQQNIQL